jgi:Ca2+/Na+ antiporter
MRKIGFFIRRNISYICAVLLWGLMLWMYWYFEHKVYGGNMKIGSIFIYALICPPIYAISYFLNKEDIKERLEQKPSKLSNIISNIILICAVLFFLWEIVFKNPYQLSMYLCLSALLFALIITYILPRKERKKKNSIKNAGWIISIIFGIQIVEVLLFCIITNPITVNGGRQLLADNGYENVQYIDNIKDPIILESIFVDCDLSLSKHEDALNFYIYLGIKNGESYGIVVSLVGRRIVAETKDENNDALLFFYNLHHRNDYKGQQK